MKLRKYRPLPDEKVEYIVVHTSASPQHYTWQWLLHFFLNILNWSVAGYHVIVEETGLVKRLVPHGKQSNGVRAFRAKDIFISNRNAIHICWEGGIDAQGNPVDNRTAEQERELIRVLEWYLWKYPNAKILGHNQVALKNCPCFNVIEWARKIEYTDLATHKRIVGIPEWRIYKGDNFKVLEYHFGYDSTTQASA